MLKPVSLFIGLRYFFASSGNRLVSFISSLAVTGLVLGVALLIVVLSVMNGFEQELRTRILGLVPHVRLYQHRGIEDWQWVRQRVVSMPGVVSATPFSRVDGMLTFRGEVQPVSLHGELLNENGNQQLQDFVDINAAEGVEKPLFLARGIADKLGVSEGAKLRMIVPHATSIDQPGRSSQLATFTLVGIFDTGTELDQRLAITRLSAASELAGLQTAAQGMQLQVEDVFSVRELRYLLRRELPMGFYSYDWTGSYGNLYQAIKMSRELVLLLIFLIVAIAAFNVISMLVMTVKDKSGAIAILRTLGCTQRGILQIFFIKGSLIGLMGCLIGSVLGVFAAHHIGDWVASLEALTGFQFLNTEVYPVDSLPSQLLWSDVAVVVAVAFGLNMLATLYPAWKAGQVQPADELRYE